MPAIPTIDQVMAPRERITIAVANSDGSGLTPLFTGCLPTVGKDEAAKLDQETTGMQRFLGNDWRSSNEKAAEDFSRAATISLVQGLTKAKIGTTEPAAEFAHGGLIQSLNQAKAYSLSNGLPRLIVYSDLAAYGLPVADTATARAKGRSDAETIAIDLQRVEVDLFTPGKATSEAATEYLKSFFLAAKGKVETIAGEGGVLASNGAPVKIAVYQGGISYGSDQYPIRMRVARDQNGSGDHVLDRGAVRPAPVFRPFPVFSTVPARTRAPSSATGFSRRSGATSPAPPRHAKAGCLSAACATCLSPRKAIN